MDDTHKITELLKAWSRGDLRAFDELLELVDHELRRIAHSYMLRERADHTLQTTALIHEALIRLMEGEKISWQSRKQFYALVARRMRQVLIEHARAQLAEKRGARVEHFEIDEVIYLSKEESQDLILLDEALTKLGEIDERKAKVVEYRYFAGFTIDETAKMLEISTATVERECSLARSWLKRELTGSSTAIFKE